MSNYSEPSVLVCIPAFNVSSTIRKVVQEAKLRCREVVVFDDGSTDNTANAAEEAGAKVIRNPRNRGYGFAIRSLLAFAKQSEVDFVVTLDGDGQHDASSIPRLLACFDNNGCDIVIGSRFLDYSQPERMPRYRSVGIRTITALTRLGSSSRVTDAQSGYRAYRKSALLRLNLFENGMGVSTEILLRAKESGLQISEVPVSIRYDVKNSSTHNPLSHGIGVVSSVLQFVSLRHPLAFYSLPGIALLVIAAFYMNNAMELYASTKYISTNMILVSVGTAVVGVVLFATGVILYTLNALLRGRIKEI